MGKLGNMQDRVRAFSGVRPSRSLPLASRRWLRLLTNDRWKGTGVGLSICSAGRRAVSVETGALPSSHCMPTFKGMATLPPCENANPQAPVVCHKGNRQ
jgi:hypothetical protein